MTALISSNSYWLPSACDDCFFLLVAPFPRLPLALLFETAFLRLLLLFSNGLIHKITFRQQLKQQLCMLVALCRFRRHMHVCAVVRRNWLLWRLVLSHGRILLIINIYMCCNLVRRNIGQLRTAYVVMQYGVTIVKRFCIFLR